MNPDMLIHLILGSNGVIATLFAIYSIYSTKINKNSELIHSLETKLAILEERISGHSDSLDRIHDKLDKVIHAINNN